MLDDILKLVVELTNTITEELNGSEKIARLMGEFERRGLQAGIDVHPFVRSIPPDPSTPDAPIPAQEEYGAADASQFSDFDIGFLKAMRILPPSEPSEKGPNGAMPG